MTKDEISRPKKPKKKSPPRSYAPVEAAHEEPSLDFGQQFALRHAKVIPEGQLVQMTAQAQDLANMVNGDSVAAIDHEIIKENVVAALDSDITEIIEWDADGANVRLRSLDQISRKARKGIKKIKIVNKETRDGMEQTVEVEMQPKVAAASLAAKISGMLEKKEQSNQSLIGFAIVAPGSFVKEEKVIEHDPLDDFDKS